MPPKPFLHRQWSIIALFLFTVLGWVWFFANEWDGLDAPPARLQVIANQSSGASPATNTPSASQEFYIGDISSFKRAAWLLRNDQTALKILEKEDLWLLRVGFFDYDGDNEKELAMITAESYCGSCHHNELRIIKNGRIIFYKDTYDVDIWPAKDLPGFSIKYPIFKIDESPSYPSEGIVESYKVSRTKDGAEIFTKVSERKEPYNIAQY